MATDTRLRRGDLVEVRTADEILATLDLDSTLDGVVFMPEMLRFCGRRFRVARRAEKTCVEGIGMRSLPDAVFLEDVRCDGGAHDGCERGCLVFWKEAWLRPITDPGAPRATLTDTAEVAAGLKTRAGDRYYCQSTELARATKDRPDGGPGEYVHELGDGEISLGRFSLLAWLSLANRLRALLRLPSVGVLAGSAQVKSRGDLALKPGERVRVRSRADIQATLDAKGKNLGLSFDPEMSRHIGRTYTVERLIQRIVLEESGKMARLANTVVLAGVNCEGICSRNCPRANPIYWREIWLERV